MRNTGLANGPQAPPGLGIPKALDGGRRSANCDASSATAPGG